MNDDKFERFRRSGKLTIAGLAAIPVMSQLDEVLNYQVRLDAEVRMIELTASLVWPNGKRDCDIKLTGSDKKSFRKRTPFDQLDQSRSAKKGFR